MELIARTGERSERVSVEREEGRYRVRVGERSYEVDSRVLGPFVRSLLVNGESYEASYFRKGERTWAIGLRGRSTDVELVDPLAHLAEQAHREAGRKGHQTVLAYMPGRVVSLAVAEGDRVEPGGPLLVLEAMKMQNEIQADRSAVVRRVHVVAGQAVEGGDPLLELE
jgi:biotin carboxyl carrier protein